MNVPSVAVVIQLEKDAPHVMTVVQNDGEHARLEDWLRAKPRLAEIIRLARELETEKRAA